MPVIRAILFSSGFHLLVILAMLWFAPLLTSKPPQTVEIELYPEGQIIQALTPKEKKQAVVRQALAPEKIKAPDDESLARFLSEQKQRVQEESRAALSGMTTNRSNKATPSAPKNPEKSSSSDNTTASKNLDMDKDGFKTVDISKELQEMNRYSDGMSTVGESLPRDVKVGSFTALNTDRYIFYTFYARLEELIRFRWESRVQHAINSFDRQTLSVAGNRNWVTQVEFLLDKNGFLQKALIMKESGIPSFDAAAVNAFKDAKVFPNPPAEMVQEDGFIHIKFSFTVNFNPPVLVNRN